jgi:hypothetical protein
VPEDDIPVLFSIVPDESSTHALLAAFQDMLTSIGPNTAPQVLVHSSQVHQDHMSISNYLSHIQIYLGTQDSENLPGEMFDSGAGLKVGCISYDEDSML